MVYTIIIFFIYSFLTSCVTTVIQDTKSLIPLNDSLIHFQSILISPSKNLYLSKGSKYLTYSISGDSAFCYLPDCENNIIRAYAVPSFSYKYTIPVPIGIDLCKQFSNYYIVDSLHYILLSDQGGIYKYSGNTINLEFDLSKINKNGMYEYTTWLLEHNQVYFTRDSSYIIPIDFERTVKSKKIEKRPYTSAIIKYGNIRYIGDRSIPHWSEEYFGLIDRTYQYFTDSTIVYMFSQSPEIRRYNYLRNELYKTEAKSSFQNKEIDKIPKKYDKDFLWNHLKKNGRYERLIYDPWKSCYYRFFYLPIPLILPDGSTSTMDDRRISLLILNKDFTIVAEKMLPEEVNYIGMAIPTISGLIINAGPIKDIQNNGLKLLQITYN